MSGYCSSKFGELAFRCSPRSQGGGGGGIQQSKRNLVAVVRVKGRFIEFINREDGLKIRQWELEVGIEREGRREDCIAHCNVVIAI